MCARHHHVRLLTQLPFKQKLEIVVLVLQHRTPRNRCNMQMPAFHATNKERELISFFFLKKRETNISMSNTTNGIPERIYIKTKTTDMWQKHNRIRKQERDKNVKTHKKRGVARIELATSRTRSENHTTRPNTQF